MIPVHILTHVFSLWARKQVEFPANNLPSGTSALTDYTLPWTSSQLLDMG